MRTLKTCHLPLPLFFFFAFLKIIISKQTSYFKVCLSGCPLLIRRDSKAFCRKDFMSGCFGQGVACPVLSSPGTAPGMRRASKYLPSRWQAGGARSSAWGGGWMSQSGEPEGELWPWLFQQRGHLNLPDCIVFTCDTRGPVVGKNQEDNSPGRTDSQFCPLP